MAAFTNKGPYKKPKREIAQREIRRLIVEEGLTNRQISERLSIPVRSVERYISVLYDHDNQLLAGLNSNEMMLTSWNICKERFESHRQEILRNIARNPKASFKDQLGAWNLIYESEAAELRMLEECAAMVKRRLPVKLIGVMGGGSLPYSNREYDGDQEKKKEEEQVK